ncbi:MAG: Mov34/MPN/PAD-1 family protein [Acidobacteria bacterium]|nr:Mov34/MPN/PAD-1 family protein [Acidobacteriota bacterium]
MRFQRPDGGCLEFSEDVVTTLERYRQNAAGATESGGVLLGRLVLDSADIVVDEITEPTVSDRRSRFFFFRSKERTQKRVTKAWCEFNGTRNYLGEWHTHPEDDPRPSPHDLANWKRIARLAKYEQNFLFFAIVGRLQIRVWEIAKQGTPQELSPIESTQL